MLRLLSILVEETLEAVCESFFLSFGLCRITALRDVQQALFRTLKDDPDRRWHPLIKIKLLEATKETLGECMQFAATLNDMTSEGIQAATLPQRILTVRRTLSTLTHKQYREQIPEKVGPIEKVEGCKEDAK
jgi:hypothetical protein